MLVGLSVETWVGLGRVLSRPHRPTTTTTNAVLLRRTSLSLSLIPIIQAADNDPNSDCTRRPTHRSHSYVPTTEELS